MNFHLKSLFFYFMFLFSALVCQFLTSTSLNWWHFGLMPRVSAHLLRIFAFPLVHASWFALLTNAIHLGLLCATVSFVAQQSSTRVLFWGYTFGGVLLWLLGAARPYFGFDVLIFTMWGYLCSYGYFREQLRANMISLCAVILWGVLFLGWVPLSSVVLAPFGREQGLGLLSGVLLSLLTFKWQRGWKRQQV
ncbi:MAG: hypothetical protein OXT67_02500 [Zetaproteobacteria bacterium]|nr:hypothetical protein [Zetaproteobacteria bacterium]